MGNTCSQQQQSDSIRVQQNNSSDKQSDILERPCIFRIPGAPQIWKIGYQVFQIDSKFTITIFIEKYKLKVDDGTFENRIIPVCFFKMEKSPSKIVFEKSGNGGFSITAYISDETSREIVVHSITWESNEYNVREEDGVFLECVKKIQKTDCSALFVSALHPMSLSAQDASATGGGNASSASEDVSPSNAPQIEVSEQVGLGQGVSTFSQTDGSLEVDSAQFDTSVVFESDIDTRASVLQTDVQRLSLDSQTSGSATLAPEVFEGDDSEARLYQIAQTYAIEIDLLEETMQNVSGGGNSAVKDVNHRQEFARCGPPEESITSSETVLTFSGKNHMFTVSDDSKSMYYRIKNQDFQVKFGIIDISSLKVYALSTGVYLIIIQTNSGQTYLSGYLSTNRTQLFATFQITSNLEEKRFQSFEHVSGTVFKCFFSDGTEKTFSIEFDSYATIKEVCHV